MFDMRTNRDAQQDYRDPRSLLHDEFFQKGVAMILLINVVFYTCAFFYSALLGYSSITTIKAIHKNRNYYLEHYGFDSKSNSMMTVTSTGVTAVAATPAATKSSARLSISTTSSSSATGQQQKRVRQEMQRGRRRGDSDRGLEQQDQDEESYHLNLLSNSRFVSDSGKTSDEQPSRTSQARDNSSSSRNQIVNDSAGHDSGDEGTSLRFQHRFLQRQQYSPLDVEMGMTLANSSQHNSSMQRQLTKDVIATLDGDEDKIHQQTQMDRDSEDDVEEEEDGLTQPHHRQYKCHIRSAENNDDGDRDRSNHSSPFVEMLSHIAVHQRFPTL